MDGLATGPLLVKQLASCSQNVRQRALRLLLKAWLPAQTSIPDSDLKKLWKGLFYCVWHADKVQFQSQLIDSLSSMLLALDLPLAVEYFSVFLVTLRREWNGIDGLRLDKFYLLIRRFVNNLFALMKKYRWDSELVGKLMGVLEERSLGEIDKIQGNGVNYHIATIFFEELRPYLPLKLETIDLLLKPFVNVVKISPDKVLLGKIRSNLFELLLTNGKNLLEAKKHDGDVYASDDSVVYGTIALKMGFSSRFFELGSSPDCVQGTRKLLFKLHEEFLKLEKEMESSGVEIPLPEPGDHVDDDDEVPVLVPIDSVNPSDAANGDTLKKRKKSKKEQGGGRDEKGAKMKKKKKKRKEEDVISENSSMEEEKSEPNNRAEEGLVFDESMMSNLQKQFEKVADEEGLNGGIGILEPAMNDDGVKKQKRGKAKKGQQPLGPEFGDQINEEDLLFAKSGEKSGKKVRFSMKNNLVWKPHTPLPPEIMRIPPTVTLRGSALTKGLSPGPIKELPPSSSSGKAKKRVRAVRKIKKKTIKGTSPAIKRLKKLKASSPSSSL